MHCPYSHRSMYHNTQVSEDCQSQEAMYSKHEWHGEQCDWKIMFGQKIVEFHCIYYYSIWSNAELKVLDVDGWSLVVSRWTKSQIFSIELSEYMVIETIQPVIEIILTIKEQNIPRPAEGCIEKKCYHRRNWINHKV